MSNSIPDHLNSRKPTVEKGGRKKSGDKKSAWLVVYQISKINPESGRPELIHVSLVVLSPLMSLVLEQLLKPFIHPQVKGQQVHVTRGQATWVKIDVKKMVGQWFRKPEENFGLVLKSYDTEGAELGIGEALASDLLLDDNNRDLQVTLAFCSIKLISREKDDYVRQQRPHTHFHAFSSFLLIL